jgi:hypothetical protein
MKLSFCIGIFSLIILIINAQPLQAQRLALVRTQFIGGTNYGVDLYNSQSIPTRDKGIIICGAVRDTGSGDLPHQPHPAKNNEDVLLIKLDSNGNKQWVKSYGGPGIEASKSICQTPDGGYGVLTGSEKRAGDFAFDRVDANGNYLWTSNNYGSSRQEGVYEIIATPDHGFLMTGYSFGADGDIPYNYKMPIVGFQPADFILIKTDSLGNKQWLSILGSTGDESYSGFSVTTDGDNFYALGAAPTIDFDCRDSLRLAVGYKGWSPYVFKLDRNGNKLWSKAVGGGYTKRVLFDPRDSSIVGMGDGGSAFEFQGSHGDNEIFLFKIDRNGKFKWAHLYGGPNYDACGSATIRLAPNGGYFLVGYTGSGNGTADGWLFLTDSVGNQLSDNLFGSLGDQAGITGVHTVTDGVVVIGYSNSYQFTEGTGHNYEYSDPTRASNPYPTNVFVSHFQLWPAGVSSSQPKNLLKVFPSPAQQQFTIELPSSTETGLIRCLDIKGQVILEQRTIAGQQRVNVTTAQWAAGAYIVSWECGAMQTPIIAKLLIQ